MVRTPCFHCTGHGFVPGSCRVLQGLDGVDKDIIRLKHHSFISSELPLHLYQHGYFLFVSGFDLACFFHSHPNLYLLVYHDNLNKLNILIN